MSQEKMNDSSATESPQSGGGIQGSDEKLFWKKWRNLPSYEELQQAFRDFHAEGKKNEKGEPADYIPELKKINPDNFGAAFCLIYPDPDTNKRMFQIGDADPVSIQSVSKPITMCAALDAAPENGSYFSKYVG